MLIVDLALSSQLYLMFSTNLLFFLLPMSVPFSTFHASTTATNKIPLKALPTHSQILTSNSTGLTYSNNVQKRGNTLYYSCPLCVSIPHLLNRRITQKDIHSLWKTQDRYIDTERR